MNEHVDGSDTPIETVEEWDERFERAERTLIEEFGDAAEPVAFVSAPGRVNLIGGHTDYNEGYVLPMAIDHRDVIAIRPREAGVVDVHSIDVEETRRFPLDSIEPSTDAPWINYVKGVVDRLLARGYEVGGAELVVNGGVPIGAGLSSSAALEVAVAGAFAVANDLPIGDDLVEICWEAETEFVGVSCGIMDQYTAVHGEPESALFLDCRSQSHEVIPVAADELTVIATDTNVQHDLVDSAYNDRVATCQEGVEYFADVLDHEVDSLRAVSVEAFEAHAAELPVTVRKRVRHVVSENDRVREAAAALRASDLETVGDLLERSHASLRDDYEVSAEELDAVVEVAGEQAGVFGSRMTGAGFGGSVVTLVRPDATERVTDAIREGYRDRTGIDPDVYVCNPDGGVRRHRAPD